MWAIVPQWAGFEKLKDYVQDLPGRGQQGMIKESACSWTTQRTILVHCSERPIAKQPPNQTSDRKSKFFS